ncbi:hypothetical protein FH508_0008635 [Lysinibacillus sp. CD3-6]|uniref:hypothetical protein n=1 Tax=Lysinibacillus sp. CD3-6 TaxID=2892541 RepID=UPI0011212418|nr:hypothetical protein [Lysinibacillus sp. CD3-6]UED81946.1 hypothetical protein FH508_0008635 [Lysinibacillus sp. CD3-6]
MLVFVGLLILVSVGGVLALMINGIITAGQGRSISSVAFNQELFTVPEPVLADVPKRAVADSHWFVKAFMRPRRKKV